MKKVMMAFCAIAVALPVALVGQGQDVTSQMKEYSQILSTQSINLTLVHLNDTTVPILFQPPTLFAMRARAKQATMFYVQGTAQKEVEIDTTKFTLSQDGMANGTPTNIKNFMRGKNKVPQGERVDGVLTFMKQVDLARTFTVNYDQDWGVEFKFTANQIRSMTPPTPAAQ